MTHPLTKLRAYIAGQIDSGVAPIANIAPVERDYEVTIKQTTYVYKTAKVTIKATSEGDARQRAFDEFHVDELAIDFTEEAVEFGDETFTAVLKEGA